MAKYSLDEILKVWIPKNTRLTFNNVQDAKDRVQIPSNAVGMYDLIKDTVEYLGISVTGNNTDISIVHNSSSVDVVSSTGTDGVINAATTSLSGVMTATDKTNLNALGTLSGVALGSLNLGTFTGTTIPNNVTIKVALQSLETSLETLITGTPIFGNLTSGTTALTVTGGTNAVHGAGTALTIVPGNILLSTLGGQLNLTQLDAGTAVLGDTMTFDGTNWGPATTIPLPHNSMPGLQGGTFLHRYHLDVGLYNKLTSATAGKLIGRNASSAGEVEFINPTNSLVITSNNLALVGDVASPGNTKYYGTNGSGTRGWYSFTTSSVSTVTATDSADIDFTITNPTTTPDITGELTITGVTPGTYGNSSQVPTITVDSKGRLTNVTPTAITLSSSSITNFSEAVDDRVSALLVAGTNVTLTYNDPSNTLTISASAAGISGSGGDYQVPYWNAGATALISDVNFIYDGTGLAINTPSVPTNVILTTKGLSTGSSAWGYQHLDSSDNIVFSVDDDGTIYIGDSSGTPLTIGNFGILKADDFYVKTTSGDLTLTTVSGLVYIDSALKIDLGSDATGDLFTRNSSGNIQRIAAGTSGYVLTSNGAGTVPTWQAAGGGGGSLPGGSLSDILVHNGTDYVSVSPITETQTGVTSMSTTLAATPLSYAPFTLYRNGLYQIVTDDYTLAGSTITWVTILASNDKVTAIYYI